jgi:hypothetical protein
MGDVVLNQLSIPLVLAKLKARRQVFDLAIAFLNSGIHAAPFYLLLVRAFDDDLTRPHVDDDVVGMEQRLRTTNASLQFPLPAKFVLLRRLKVFVIEGLVGDGSVVCGRRGSRSSPRPLPWPRNDKGRMKRHVVANRMWAAALRQVDPDRKTQKMPLRTRRSSTRGMPRGLFGSIGLMTLQSWSLSS